MTQPESRAARIVTFLTAFPANLSNGIRCQHRSMKSALLFAAAPIIIRFCTMTDRCSLHLSLINALTHGKDAPYSLLKNKTTLLSQTAGNQAVAGTHTPLAVPGSGGPARPRLAPERPHRPGLMHGPFTPNPCQARPIEGRVPGSLQGE